MPGEAAIFAAEAEATSSNPALYQEQLRVLNAADFGDLLLQGDLTISLEQPGRPDRYCQNIIKSNYLLE